MLHLTPGFERVYAVLDYYDCPRSGVANFLDRPRLFRCDWDDALDDWASTYRLFSLPPELFVDLLESAEIWLRYEAAFHSGVAAPEDHPALPLDRRRYDELHIALAGRVESLSDELTRVSAEFAPLVARDPSNTRAGLWPPLEVRWTRLAQ